MLKIQRLKIIIRTGKGDYGFDHVLGSGLNIIASSDNTSGKSAIINGLFFVLGFEQLIEGTGTGAKTLSQAYTKQIIVDELKNAENVLESEVQAEVSNGSQVVTIRRYAKHQNINEGLVTVYESSIDGIAKTVGEDMYVNSSGSATHQKGFHKYFEEFLGLELPEVLANDGAQRKLYLQLVFGAMFIEQKHGWGGFLAGIPYLGIQEARKRVIEFLIGLSTLADEKQKRKIKRDEDRVNNSWKQIIAAFQENAKILGLQIINMVNAPTLAETEIDAMTLVRAGQSLDVYLNELKVKSSELSSTEQKIDADTRVVIQTELLATQSEIADFTFKLSQAKQTQNDNKISVAKTTSALEIVQTDLINNNDAKKLRQLGSEQGIKDFDHLCPTCGCEITDSLLATNIAMSIDENIIHLKSQETLFEFTLAAKQKMLEEIETNINQYNIVLADLRKLESVLKGDLTRIKGDYSHAKVFEKVKVDDEISKIEKLVLDLSEIKQTLLDLQKQWRLIQDEKSKLSKGCISERDKTTLRSLRNNFVKLLNDFGYRSTSHVDSIQISEDSFMPTLHGFDIKYDSSASDMIRDIWAFTIALMQTSIDNRGNHPRIIIYDEPKQQSVIDDSFEKLCDKLIAIGDSTQTILGVTAIDNGVKSIISKLDGSKYNLIDIGNRAFKIL